MQYEERRIKKYFTLFVAVCFIVIFGITWIGKYDIPTLYSTHGPYQYRLGDMVEGNAYRNSSAGRTSHYHRFPNSIATEYMKRTDDNHRYDILSDIVERRTGNKSNLVPPKDMLLIHLRLGDVIDRTNYSVHKFLNNNISFINGGLYVKPLSYYKGIVYQIKEYKIKSVMLIGGFHKPLKSTTKSTAYMHKIKEYFESNNIKVYERLQQHDADEDFIYMCNAEYFTPGGGGFSDLVRGVVCFRGKHIVSSNKNSTAECDVVGMWSSSVHQEIKPLLAG
jgi:hypothetical protein